MKTISEEDFASFIGSDTAILLITAKEVTVGQYDRVTFQLSDLSAEEAQALRDLVFALRARQTEAAAATANALRTQQIAEVFVELLAPRLTEDEVASAKAMLLKCGIDVEK